MRSKWIKIAPSIISECKLPKKKVTERVGKITHW